VIIGKTPERLSYITFISNIFRKDNEMAKVQFYNIYSWDNIPEAKPNGFYRLAVIERLADMRQDWRKAVEVDGKTLVEVLAPVGVVLSDFCDLLELNPEERETVLGVELARVTA
jgi:hypothetical protein